MNYHYYYYYYDYYLESCSIPVSVVVQGTLRLEGEVLVVGGAAGWRRLTAVCDFCQSASGQPASHVAHYQQQRQRQQQHGRGVNERWPL